jgi:hypothetical protein
MSQLDIRFHSFNILVRSARRAWFKACNAILFA